MFKYFAARSEVADFLPPARGIVESPPSPAGRLTLWLICLFFCAALLWALLGHVEIVAVGQGKIIPTEQVKLIQPKEIGKVVAIHVRNGDEVRAGQVLVELARTEAGSEAARTSRELLDARLNAARLSALISGDAFPIEDFPDADPNLVAIQRSMMEAARAEQAAKLADLDGQIAQAQADAAEATATISKLEQTLPLVRERYEALKDLADRNVIPRLRLVEYAQEKITNEQDLVVNQNKLKQSEANITALRERRAQAIAEFNKTNYKDLAEAEKNADGLLQEKRKAEDRLGNMTLTAPVDGVVQQLAVHTIGGVVTPAQSLMVLVPKDTPLEVEAWLQNRDIGFVQPGQDVVVKIDTFNFTKYGYITGKVISVSKTAVENPQNLTSEGASTEPQQNRSQPPQLVYVARVSLPQRSMVIDGRETELVPGMSVNAEIKTGERRVIEFLMSPVMKVAQESLRER